MFELNGSTFDASAELFPKDSTLLESVWRCDKSVNRHRDGEAVNNDRGQDETNWQDDEIEMRWTTDDNWWDLKKCDRCLNVSDGMVMRALIDRRTSHLAQVDVAEELQDCQFSDARVLVARAVEDVVQHLDYLIKIITIIYSTFFHLIRAILRITFISIYV